MLTCASVMPAGRRGLGLGAVDGVVFLLGFRSLSAIRVVSASLWRLRTAIALLLFIVTGCSSAVSPPQSKASGKAQCGHLGAANVRCGKHFRLNRLTRCVMSAADDFRPACAARPASVDRASGTQRHPAYAQPWTAGCAFAPAGSAAIAPEPRSRGSWT